VPLTVDATSVEKMATEEQNSLCSAVGRERNSQAVQRAFRTHFNAEQTGIICIIA